MSKSDDHIRMQDKIYLHEGFRGHYDALSRDEQIQVDEFVKELSERVTNISEKLKSNIFNSEENSDKFIKDLDEGLYEIMNSEDKDVEDENR